MYFFCVLYVIINNLKNLPLFQIRKEFCMEPYIYSIINKYNLEEVMTSFEACTNIPIQITQVTEHGMQMVQPVQQEDFSQWKM